GRNGGRGRQVAAVAHAERGNRRSWEPCSAAEPAAAVEHRELSALLGVALDGLDMAERSLLDDWLDGMSRRQMARQHVIDESTVTRRVRRLIDKLHAQLPEAN